MECLEAVELPFLRRESRLRAIGLHGAPQRAPVNGYAAVGDEEIRCGIGAGVRVGAQPLNDIRLQGVDTREEAFQTVNGNASLLQVHVGALQQADLRGAQAVAVSQEEQPPYRACPG
jgi:hypothetical protein